jgi:hypothetical protein
MVTMKKLACGWLIAIFISSLTYCFAKEQPEEGILILSEARQYGKASVSVEAYLKDLILEVTVSARVYADRPKIDNVIVVGPRLGRLSAKAKTSLFATEEDEEEPEVTESRGLLGFGSRSTARKKKGVLVKERYKFKIPPKKIVSGKRYELRVKIDSPKIDSKSIRFKFELKDFARHVLEKDAS